MTMENIYYELLESEADYRFFIQWDDEKIAKKAAMLIMHPYSIGSKKYTTKSGKKSQVNGWTVWFSTIEQWGFKTEKEALDKVREIFSGGKKSGNLLMFKGNSRKPTLFSRVEVA